MQQRDKNKIHLNDDMHVEFFSVKSNAFIESSSLTVIEIHCHINLHSVITTM